MSRKEFFQKVHKSVTRRTKEIIAAYWLAKAVHGNQIRDDGKPYFEHCREVDLNLMKYCNPTNPDELIMGLLHDTTEDQYIPEYIIRKLFGKKVADGIEFLSKTTPKMDRFGEIIKVAKNKEIYFKNLTKSTESVRRVKLADRLHNISNMEVWDIKKQIGYIAETKRFILPLADFQNASALKTALEKTISEKEAHIITQTSG